MALASQASRVSGPIDADSQSYYQLRLLCSERLFEIVVRASYCHNVADSAGSQCKLCRSLVSIFYQKLR